MNRKSKMYKFFYKVATYANKNWKGNFTPEELATYAEDLCEEAKRSDNIYHTHAICVLTDNLIEDADNGSDEADDLVEGIKYWCAV